MPTDSKSNAYWDELQATFGPNGTGGVEGSYTKPGSGIPSSDMTTAVQTALTAAGSALQSVTKTAVINTGLAPSDIGGAALGDPRLNTPYLSTLVYDGVTDNSAAIQAALASNNVVTLPPNLGITGFNGCGVASPIILGPGQGIAVLGASAGGPASSQASALFGLTGFSGSLSSPVQTAYPQLPASTPWVVIMAGAGAFLQNIQVSGSHASGALYVGAAGCALLSCTLTGGTVVTLESLGSAANTFVVNASYIAASQSIDNSHWNGNDWNVCNSRFVSGTKIINVGDAMVTNCHFTGSNNTLGTANVILQKRANMANVYFDSSNFGVSPGAGAAILVNQVTGTQSVINNARFMQNNTGESVPCYYNSVTTGGVNFIGGWAAPNGGAVSAIPLFWDHTCGWDSVDGLAFRSALFTNFTGTGTGRVGRLTIDNTQVASIPTTSGAPSTPPLNVANTIAYDPATKKIWVVTQSSSQSVTLA